MRTAQGSTGAGGAWELVEGRPEPRLRGHILGYRGFRQDLRQPRRRLEVPTDVLTLTIGFGAPMRLLDAVSGGSRGSLVSSVAGLHRTASIGEHGGRMHGVAVSLTPRGAYAVLGPVAAELASQWADLRDVLGPPAAELVDRLAGASGWTLRFALLDAFFTARLAAGHDWAPEVGLAWAGLRRSAGTVPVARLAQESGWSLRRLQSRFRAQVGLPPKQVAQILRLQRTLAAFVARPELTGAEIAALCGYYDQAHLDRTFRSMVGCSPGAFLGHRAAPAGAEPTDRLVGRITTAVLPEEPLSLSYKTSHGWQGESWPGPRGLRNR
ncbi:helix-turn-helix transcriptional regulator [Kitasatospora sp. NBC_00374]|uniref:helix-turn-helix domain-containing protein n=1 Tax=Kitasatospora sp. NBC_00374 TaxID=2975964 RepID=UPI00325145EB